MLEIVYILREACLNSFCFCFVVYVEGACVTLQKKRKTMFCWSLLSVFFRFTLTLSECSIDFSFATGTLITFSMFLDPIKV